ncbi:MAG: hypothetical protein AABY84_01490 [Candidatus Firestonebacteria bacterium]
MKKFKRRQYLINKKMQLKYAAMIAGTLIFLLVLIELHTFYIIKAILPNLFSTSVKEEIRDIVSKLLISGVLYLILITVLSIFVSHKIAGPVYRFNKDINEIIHTGKFDKYIRVREKDELQDVAKALNNLIQDWSHKSETIKINHKVIADKIEQVIKELQTSNLPENLKAKNIAELHEAIKILA